jgi:hypothetical protein
VPLGIGICWLLGAAWGLIGFNFSVTAALGFVLLGTLPGLFFGLLGGLVVGAVANLCGKP